MRIVTLSIMLVTLFSCQKVSEGKLEKVRDSRKQSHQVQIAPAGTAEISSYEFLAKVVMYRNDTLVIEADSKNAGEKLLFEIPNQGKDGILPVGTSLSIEATHLGGVDGVGVQYHVIK